MTAFLGAMPHPSSESSTCFHVSAAENPSVLARVAGLFAKLTVVPDAFSAERAGDGGLAMEIRVAGLSAGQSEHLAQALRQIIEVEAVLVGLEDRGQTRARA